MTTTGHQAEMPAIVERQMRNWELAQSQGRPAATRDRPDHHRVKDFICVSRMPGVGMPDIVAALVDRLGWPAFDKEILQYMAGDDTVRARIYKSMDERDIGFVEDAVRAIAQPEYVRNDYFHKLYSNVLALAVKGPAVFVGRGCDLILPRDIGWRIRIVASRNHRVVRHAAETGMEPGAAARDLDRIDKERDEFIRHFFKADPHDLCRYDLTVNMDRVTIPQAVNLILDLHGTTP